MFHSRFKSFNSLVSKTVHQNKTENDEVSEFETLMIRYLNIFFLPKSHSKKWRNLFPFFLPFQNFFRVEIPKLYSYTVFRNALLYVLAFPEVMIAQTFSNLGNFGQERDVQNSQNHVDRSL